MRHFNHFDMIASSYDRIIKPPEPERMRRLLKMPTGGLLLDVGGGTGRSSYQFYNLAKEIVIADSSMGMLKEAVKKGNLVTVRTNSETLAFIDASFERVIMVDALHHVADYVLTIRELWRIVKPGGRIVIEEPNIETLPVKLMAFFEKLALMRSHFISPPKILEAFRFSNSAGQIDREGTTAWVIIDKLNEE